jgi:outer membrane immunogenic protein
MLKKLLLASVGAAALAGPALGADLAPVAPPPAFTWTGFYLGGQVGYGWGEDSSNVWLSGPLGALKFPATSGSASTQTQGVIGGVHLGYNWQLNQFVLGLEGRADGTSINKFTQPVASLAYNVSTSSPIQGSLVGRVGYAFDRTLFYVIGGGGYGWIHNKYTILNSEGDFSTTRSFWTVGGGIEYAISDNWLVRAEYRHSDFGYFYDGTIIFPKVFQSHKWTQNDVQIAFSYKWAAAAPVGVVAKY